VLSLGATAVAGKKLDGKQAEASQSADKGA
jgi:hypothetical protein